MPGTSAGMRKAWETRREKYGPSGRAGGANTAKSSSGGTSSKARSSKNTNRSQRDVRRINGRTIPYDHQLEQWGYEREGVIKGIREVDRVLSGNPKGLPPYVLQMYRESRNKMTVQLRHLDDKIESRQRDVIDRENKKHGRRYNT